MGIMGACRANEMHNMNIEDIQDLGSTMLVTIPNTKTKIVRQFTITGQFYYICKKYINLRPADTSTSFFLNFQNGKCTVQKIGINKFAAMGKQIATFLNLPQPEMYTSHTFRRSSLLVDTGADIMALKRHGGWKSASVAEGYVDDSVTRKTNTANKILQSVKQCSSTLHTTTATQQQNNTSTSTVNENFDLDFKSTPSIHFTNCSNLTNITINFGNGKYEKK